MHFMLQGQFCTVICFLLSQALCSFYKSASVNERVFHSVVFVVYFATMICGQCFDAVGWASKRTAGL